MRLFGISIWTILIIIGAMILGAKRPDLVMKIPFVSKI